ncbi:MAG: hypothetical protein AVDCRST_MAG95-3535 [uncultured Adhaeribacter sp.]|uniref:RNA polymerase sigma-70 region 2 domain-containing protein n=1 Tax=uncultured Adhaeribacter sp. TaxID=448109 RepID=A0A6J4JPX1_9BACT|nr:MAG: hypothetical protein AVDCRST_MAG95-3535 [uncultured Adhaeribacter sp.]
MANGKTIELETRKIDPHQWVELHADYLYNYAFTRINNEEQARDLVQDTFLAALEKVAHFNGKSSERTWLVAILKNKVVDVYRKRAAGLTISADLETTEHEQQNFFDATNGHWHRAHQPLPLQLEEEDPYTIKEFKAILQQCLQKLPALWLAVFTMKHLEEEASEKICSALKITPANFWVIVHRTKLNLRACLQKNWN